MKCVAQAPHTIPKESGGSMLLRYWKISRTPAPARNLGVVVAVTTWVASDVPVGARRIRFDGHGELASNGCGNLHGYDSRMLTRESVFWP